MAYESIADIEKQFKRRIAEASEEELPSIKLELAEAKVDFMSQRESARALEDAKRRAFEQFPRAKDFSDLVRGGTAEEIEAEAKKIHDRMESLAPAQPQPEPQQPDPATMAYGQSGVGGAGNPPPASNRQRELFDKMKGIGGGRRRNMSAAESEEYIRMRLPQVLKVTKDNPGVPIGLGRGANQREVLK
jgi:hypothetical protein